VPTALVEVAKKEGVEAAPQEVRCGTCRRFICELAIATKSVGRFKCGKCGNDTTLVLEPDRMTILRPQ
jgi:Zn finger protein HypA/HybF involved in hydrogenase expression